MVITIFYVGDHRMGNLSITTHQIPCFYISRTGEFNIWYKLPYKIKFKNNDKTISNIGIDREYPITGSPSKSGDQKRGMYNLETRRMLVFIQPQSLLLDFSKIHAQGICIFTKSCFIHMFSHWIIDVLVALALILPGVWMLDSFSIVHFCQNLFFIFCILKILTCTSLTLLTWTSKFGAIYLFDRVIRSEHHF